MISAIRKWTTYCDSNKGKIFPYILLAALGFGFFQPVVRFPPVDFDDLLLLSSSNTRPTH